MQGVARAGHQGVVWKSKDFYIRQKKYFQKSQMSLLSGRLWLSVEMFMDSSMTCLSSLELGVFHQTRIIFLWETMLTEDTIHLSA